MTLYNQESDTEIAKVIADRYPLSKKGSLRSIDFFTVVDCIAEGEIEGSSSASKLLITDKTSDAYRNAFLQDVFLNKTSVIQRDADPNNVTDEDINFKDILFEFNDGTSNQPVLKGAIAQEQPFIGGDLTKQLTFIKGDAAGTPRSVTAPSNPRFDGIRITILFQALFRLDDEGNKLADKGKLKFSVNPANGPLEVVLEDEVAGRSFSAYSKDYFIDFRTCNNFDINNPSAFFPVEVICEKLTDDGTSNNFREAFFQAATGIIFESNNYPNIAHAAFRFSAETFPNLPSRTFRIRGRKIKLPDVAQVDKANGRVTYTGNWEGSFSNDKQWCSDPAWILYDILTEPLAGCGIAESFLDKFSFFKVSKYCNQLVSDGKGGQEPRFSLNVNINSQKDALTLVRDVCAVMNSNIFFENGEVKLSQDSPTNIDDISKVDYAFVFNNSNVKEGLFNYEGSSINTRFNTINVSYFDMENFTIDYITEKDENLISKYGIRQKTIKSFGVTSRSQAIRIAKWFLNSQNKSGEVVTFISSIAAGQICSIGDVIAITDRVKKSIRRGGRIVSAANDGSSVVIDDITQTNLPEISTNPTISCLMPDGTVQTKFVENFLGTTVTMKENFSQKPVENSAFIIEQDNNEAALFKISTIKHNTDNTFTFIATEHNPNKYQEVEQDIVVPDRTINNILSILPSPSGLVVEEEIAVVNNRAVAKLIFDWQGVQGASAYLLSFRKEDETNFTDIVTQESNAEVFNVTAGLYTVRIQTQNALGQTSKKPLEQELNVLALSKVPDSPTTLQIQPINDYQVKLNWTKSTELDVLFGGTCVIRHTPDDLATAKFQNATDLDVASGNVSELVVPAITGTYLMKFKDIANNFSAGEVKVNLPLPEVDNNIKILEQRENPSFAGTKNFVQVDNNKLTLTDPSSDLRGNYTFANTVDIGQVIKNVRIVRHIKVEAITVSDLFDDIPNLDLRPNFDGLSVDDPQAELLVAVSQLFPQFGNSGFSIDQVLTNGSFSGKGFRFKAKLRSESTNENIRIIELGVDMFLNSRTETFYKQNGASGGPLINSEITSGTSSLDVFFGNPFFVGTSDTIGGANKYLPIISISPKDLPSGGFFELSNITGEKFTIIFKNSSSNPISVKFNFQALGYGKGA